MIELESIVEAWQLGQLDRAVAADIVGLDDLQVRNVQTRYGLFPEKKEGKGHRVTYDLRDVMKLAAFKLMVDDGFPGAVAAKALAPYSVYQSLMQGGPSPVGHYPGTFFLSRNADGRWIGREGYDVLSSYQIRVWPLFDRIWPKFADAIIDGEGARMLTRDERVAMVAEFKAQIDQLRATRWGA